MSDHWNDLAEKLGTPSLNPLPRKSPSASKPSKSEPEAPQAVQIEEPIQPAPAKAEEVKPAKRSSWDALLGVFGIGGSSEPETPKQAVAAEAPKAKSSLFAAPEVQQAPEEAPVVDEIGWQAPPRKRGRDKEVAKPVANREPEVKAELREQAPSREAAPREQAPREQAPRQQNRDHRSRDRRPNAEADAHREAAAPRDKQSAPRDSRPAQRDAGKKDIRPSRDRAGKKTRAPSLWDEPAETVEDESPIIESIDDIDLEANDNEVVERRGRRRPPRRGHQIRNEDEVRDVVSEPAADIEEPVSSDDRPEQRPPRGGRGRGRDNRRDGNRDGATRDAGRDGARGDSSSRDTGRETSGRDASSRESGPRESGPRENNPRGPRENNRPRRDDRRGAPAARGHQRAAEPIEDSLDVDSVDEVADTWGLSAEEPVKEEAPTRSRRGNRGRRRGRNADREALPSDENAELVDGDDLGVPADDEEGPTRHIKIPTWSEAIGILVELNTENHKKVGNTPQGNRHRGGGGGRRGGGGGYNGGRGRDNNPPR